MPYKEPLYDREADQFTRGAHEGRSLDSVAEDEPDYLILLVTKWRTDQDTTDVVEQYIEDHPDVFEDVEL